MKINTTQIKLNTKNKFDIIDITAEINSKVNINKGIISIFSKHSTSAIVLMKMNKVYLKI